MSVSPSHSNDLNIGNGSIGSGEHSLLDRQQSVRGRIVVYTISGCPYCRRAIAKLNELGLPHSSINLDDVPGHHRHEMLEKSGGKTSVPQIFFNGKHLGGYENLENAISSGLIDEFVREVVEHMASDSAPQIPTKEREFDMLDDGYDLQFSCERDEYAQLVHDLRESGLIADRYYHLRQYKQCFVGRELVDWLCSNRGLSRQEATDIGQKLTGRKFVAHVCGDHGFKDGYFFFRLLENFHTKALNMKYSSDCEPQQASQLAEVMRGSIVLLYNDYLSQDGRHVDYSSMAESRLFKQYEQLSSELQRLDLVSLSWDIEKIAFFINIYNALVVHSNVVHGSPKNAWERQKFFSTCCYMIGGQIYTLQDIENGILRGNRKGVGALRKPFGKTDPRLIAVVQQVDPRVHFALVCGAKSCPPIKTYSAVNLNEELELAANSFLQDGGVTVNLEKNEIHLNRILGWYRSDFGSSTKELLQFISEHMGSCELHDKFTTAMANNAKVSFLPYDWSLNGS